LEITFLGSITAHDVYGTGFEEGIYLWFGEHPPAIVLGSFENGTNSEIINYEWFCKADASPLSLFSWNLNKNIQIPIPARTLTPNSLADFGTLTVFDKSAGETITLIFSGVSETNGKLLYEPPTKVEFQVFKTLPVGQSFPLELKMIIFLENITEDDYTISFWSETERIGVGSAPDFLGSRESFTILKPQFFVAIPPEPPTGISVSTAIKNINNLDGKTIEIFGKVTERPSFSTTTVCIDKLETIPEYSSIPHAKYVIREFKPSATAQAQIIAIGDPESTPLLTANSQQRTSTYRYAPTEFELEKTIQLTGILEKTTYLARDCQSIIPSAIFVVDRVQWGKESLPDMLLSFLP